MHRNNKFEFYKGNIEIHNSSHSFRPEIKNTMKDKEVEVIQTLKSFFENNRLPYKIHPGSF